MIIKNLSVDGHSINLENKSIFRVMSTVAIIYLPKAVQSNSSANISIEWSFTLPINFTLRIGVYDTSTFLLDIGIRRLPFMMTLMVGIILTTADRQNSTMIFQTLKLVSRAKKFWSLGNR